MKLRYLAYIGASMALCTLALPSFAQQADAFESLGAAVRFERYQTDFNVGQGTYKTDVDEIGLAFRQYFGKAFSLAVGAGYADLSMDGNPATLKLSPSGVYARITARYQWWLGDHLGMDFVGAGAFHRVEDSAGTNSVTDRWWSYALSVGPRYRIKWFNVGAGVVYRHASGNQQASFPAGKLSLDYARTTNPYLDFDFTVAPHGTFGIHLQGGARRSAALVFGYRFVEP